MPVELNSYLVNTSAGGIVVKTDICVIKNVGLRYPNKHFVGCALYTNPRVNNPDLKN